MKMQSILSTKLKSEFKTALTFIFSVTVAINLNGQYAATVDSNYSWTIAHKQLFDDVIGNLSLSESDSNQYFNMFFTFYPGLDSLFYGQLREDVESGKIYYIHPDSNNEQLIFDLELQESDTFETPFWTGSYMHVVNTYEIDGRKHIEFDTQTEWNESVKFIEGVGPNIGLFWTWLNSGVMDPFVICQYEQNEELYVSPNSLFEDCDLVSTDLVKNDLDHKIVVFPNPVVDILNVSNESKQPIFIEITDLFGKVIITHTSSNKSIHLNVNIIKEGNYILKIYNQKNQIIIKKLIVI